DRERDALENFPVSRARAKIPNFQHVFSIRISESRHPHPLTPTQPPSYLATWLPPYPTLPSKLTPSSFCASTANSIGSSLNTSLQNPFTIMEMAFSVSSPRCLQ